jgi:hypothetical protein
MAMKDDSGDVDVMVEKVRGKRDDSTGTDDAEEERKESPQERIMESAASDLCDALGTEDADVGRVKDALWDFYRACMKGGYSKDKE